MIQHLLELRRRLCWIALIFFSLVLIFLTFASNVFHYLVSPLLQILPVSDGLIATDLTTPLLTPIQLAIDVALLCTIPFVLFHLWRFVAPGLYRHEQRLLQMMIGLSVLLFCGGAWFCFYWVLPFMLNFFVQAVPQNVHLMPDMGNTVDFITRMLMLFGLSFQVPLVCLVLVSSRVMTIAQLKAARPYWIVSAFIIGMLLTPPDVLSQVTLAVPLCLLYELGIGLIYALRVNHQH